VLGCQAGKDEQRTASTAVQGRSIHDLDAADVLPRPAAEDTGPLSVRLARPDERDAIYRMRHEVYARELGQHHANPEGRLSDPLDAVNLYIVIAAGEHLLGFVSITPPGSPTFSIDKYFRRSDLPFPVDDKTFEVRLLTVSSPARRTLFALALIYAAFRWVEAHGGSRIMAIGRQEVLSIYRRVGLKPAGQLARSGAVTYELMQATMPDVHAALPDIGRMLDRVEAKMAWQIGVDYRTPAQCVHGGQFFQAVGEEFEGLERLESIISADVLDAWFPPSPKAVAVLQAHLSRLLRTSPPTEAAGLTRAIARARGVGAECVLPGAGSSALIFLALRHWLTTRSRVLILDPMYGEYAHVLERVVRCSVDRLPLERQRQYQLDLGCLERQLAAGYDLVVLVNPNSPTGRHVGRAALEDVLRRVPAPIRVWVDETYVDYTGPGNSLEHFAVLSPNVIVCKSMSKAYALSGARVAYLCAGAHQLESLRAISPPWAVSLPAQVATVAALQDTAYYARAYEQTCVLREHLTLALVALGWEVVPSTTNFLLCHLPPNGPDAATLIARCQRRGLYLRDASTMGRALGSRALRLAVKDEATNRRMVEILRTESHAGAPGGSDVQVGPQPASGQTSV
jgi:histidinol-phosphate/aromatic aminotransferase/cobyric acid decarboxylase-like protein